jgi:hypothetical protein
MNSHEKTTRRVNSSLTKRVIELHGKGYDHDFLAAGKQHLLCLQNNQNFTVNDVNIKVIDQAYDHLTRSFKYIHTIVTCNGERGVLITEGIFTNLPMD